MRKTVITLSIIGCLFPLSGFAQQNNPMLQHGLSLLDRPYVAHTLERTEKEQLFTDRSGLDCTTFVECVMAMSLSAPSGNVFSEESFAENLQKIRYRNGVIDGYPSRLHYIADWVNDNVQKGIIEDITALYSTDTDTVRLFFMSTHPDKYKHLKNSPKNVAEMAAHEKRITGQEIHWLPKQKLPAGGLPWIKDGDIIMLTTNIAGLDVSHMGIAIYQQGKLHLLHSSSVEKKVVIDKRTLRNQLTQSKNVTGIRVLRIK